jgi:pimeloyl-ACP methyl ester carboxylesterase
MFRMAGSAGSTGAPGRAGCYKVRAAECIGNRAQGEAAMNARRPATCAHARIFLRAIGITILAAIASLAIVRGAAAQEQGFALAGGPRQLLSEPTIYTTRYLDRIGPTFYDKIALHRVALGPRTVEHRAITVLYLPGTNMNGEIAVENPRYSLPVYLALRGVDVWTMDYRTHFVPPGVTASTVDSVFKRWTNQEFAADVERAAKFILATTKSRQIYVAGFSRGVEFAYLFAAMHPGQVRGLIVLDGFIPRRPSRQMPPGRIVEDIGGPHLTYEKRHFLMQSVIANPDGPAPLPKYRTARENLMHVVYDSRGFGGKGGLANPQGGFSDPVVLARVLIGYDRYWPAIQDYNNPFTPALLKSLKESKIPVIAFSSTNIAPDWPAWVLSSAKSTGTDPTFSKLEGWGHLDVLCGNYAPAKVYQPIMNWLRRHQMEKGNRASRDAPAAG